MAIKQKIGMNTRGVNVLCPPDLSVAWAWRVESQRESKFPSETPAPWLWFKT